MQTNLARLLRFHGHRGPDLAMSSGRSALEKHLYVAGFAERNRKETVLFNSIQNTVSGLSAAR